MATPNPPKIYTSSVPNGTPVRDRSHRSDYPSSATSSPATMRSNASFSNTPPPNPPNPAGANPAPSNNQLLTVDGLLAVHEGTPNPMLAALESAVSERNNLSSQNTQLWKLVEKQRSGYNHIMKELERLRGERDLYRSRLHHSGENTDALLRAHRAKEKAEGKDSSLRSAPSHSQLKPSESSASTSSVKGPPSLDPRAHLLRTHSDESPVRGPQLSPSRSFDPTQSPNPSARMPMTPERKGSQGTANATRSESPTPSLSYLSASQASSSNHTPSPLSISSNERDVEATPRKSPPLAMSPTEGSFSQPSLPTPVPARSDSLSVSSTPTPSPSTATRSTKPTSPGESADPVLGAWQPQGPPRAAPQPPQLRSQAQSQNTVVLTPATPERDPYRAQAPVSAPSTETTRATNGPTPNGRPPSPSRPPPINPAPPSQPVSITLNGNSTLAVGRQSASRDSQISLPEETKRYYASMASPAASPGMKFSFPTTESNSPLKQESPAVNGPPPSHSETNGARVNGAAPTGVGLGVPMNGSLTPEGRGRPNGRVPGSRAGSVTTEEGAEFLDMEDEDSAYDTGASSAQYASYEDTPPRGSEDSFSADRRREKEKIVRPAVEDFPLPPGTSMPQAPAQQYAHESPPPASQAQMGTPSRQGSLADSGRDSRPSMSTSDSHAAQAPSQSSSQTAGQDQQPPPSPFPLPRPANPPQMKFRALPLLAEDLPHTEVVVVNSSIRPNDRGKEVLSFIISVDPGRGKESWRVEKHYSDVLSLDARVRNTVGRSAAKKLATLPEGRLWRDHAPAKVDQRKIALEAYLRSLISLPVKNKDEIIAFFTSDIVRDTQKPVSQAGYKEGYLTKRGKNFGGWKSRYFVLQGPSLEYYESRGGTHLGSIVITGAQIGRQQRAAEKREVDEDNEYRHAFLIIEPRRGPAGSAARHVLCADSDEDRDSWVEELVRYVSGTYNEEQAAMAQGSGPSPVSAVQLQSAREPRSSTSSNPPTDLQSTPVRRTTKDIMIAKGPAVPISQLAQDSSNAKLFSVPQYPEDSSSSGSPAKSSIAPSVLEADVPLSTSLPASSPLVEEPEAVPALSQRANSELGHYPDLDQRATPSRSPEQLKRQKMKRMSMKPTSIPERSPSPERDPNTPRADAYGKVKISGPMNGTPIPSGYKFGAKEAPPPEQPPPMPISDRREKTKSRTFKNWGFGKTHDKPVPAAMPTYIPRAVFGVSLEESLDIAQIGSLPAIVFRCIQYLETKKAEHEEGIYRLSGSSAVIKGLKDRFNAEGDVDLLASDEYWDPHAIAGLLKTFLRELPASILTRDLHLRFLSVIDFVDPQERIRELSFLISSLPLANYSLLRALTAHLILIVQNAHVNKMTMRNVGIVFSPTLGIPAGVFSLMLGEFKRVFNVDGTLDEPEEPVNSEEAQTQSAARRNSQHYSEAAADQMLGLSGRALPEQQEDSPSEEGEDDAVEESGTEATTENDAESLVESSAASSVHAPQVNLDYADTDEAEQAPGQSASRSRASALAATRGLSVATDKASRRHSRMVGLPASPRPPQQPMPSQPPQAPPNGTEPSPHAFEAHQQMQHSPSMSHSPHRPT
ncbi:hypothetical protein OH76DRAFT_1086068 [Lentinus brumalis]|uniref:RhoGAP-domain-containing protein n=2 Tax=Lentinus brumalis TaxID=2498619 RepID=A0A371DPA5_9APHY|nr:hypothetical protein OH76DRAFT_1086068 [Polyporus brumalis]